MPYPTAETGYAFDNRSAEADTQLNVLETFLDPISAARLAPPVVGPGAVCWEVGAGAGSVARLMARTAGPHGRVVATDIETAHLTSAGTVTVLRHDVRHEPPPGGPFDVIHARLVLLHLPERKRVLRELVTALKPGGWLVLEEFDCTVPLRVLTAPSDEAAKLFQQVVEGMLDVLQDRGADLAWAQNVHSEMALAGLTEIDTITYSESWSGSARESLLEVNCRQLEPRLIAAGYTVEQLANFRALTRDPRFASLSYQLVSTRGRRPH
jgi:ubiquinone/menaquinone biosynthesis C-methylase UbiE